jgi:hypothetical protein
LLQLIGIWPLAFVGLLIATLPFWFVIKLPRKTQPALSV